MVALIAISYLKKDHKRYKLQNVCNYKNRLSLSKIITYSSNYRGKHHNHGVLDRHKQTSLIFVILKIVLKHISRKCCESIINGIRHKTVNAHYPITGIKRRYNIKSYTLIFVFWLVVKGRAFTFFEFDFRLSLAESHLSLTVVRRCQS